MFADSVIDADLIHAYRKTHYQIQGAAPFTLRVDEPSAGRAAAHKHFRTECSAFITACNPYSEDVGAASNAQRHADLASGLAHRSLAHAEGIGQHPSNGWPGEPSSVALGLTLEVARTPVRGLKMQGGTPSSGATPMPCRA